MNSRLSAAERAYLARVKLLPCSVCDRSGPSEAHHIRQKQTYTCVALCRDCHRDQLAGWHGMKRMWAIRKMDELDALAITIRRLNGL